MLGLGLGITLATGFLFRAALGWPVASDRAVSAWSFEETSKPTGPADAGPVDVGTTWLVGAAAVGSCLGWWLSFLGVVGEWVLIDGDVADATNLNRSLGLFATDAGVGGVDPIPKVRIPGSDGYVTCRLPEDEPRFACATGPGEPVPSGRRRDGALPFLSAASVMPEQV